MKQQGSWAWAKKQAKQIIYDELFRNGTKRTVSSYKDMLNKYTSMQINLPVEGKVRIRIVRYLFMFMQKHVDKRLASGETIKDILSN